MVNPGDGVAHVAPSPSVYVAVAPVMEYVRDFQRTRHECGDLSRNRTCRSLITLETHQAPTRHVAIQAEGA